MTYRTLARPLVTVRGTYVAGLQVLEITTSRPGHVRVCLDPYGAHLGRRCHAATIPAAWLAPTKASTLAKEAA